MPKCKICAAESRYVFTGTILKKYEVKYYQCSGCGFLQTEDPYWLEESYCKSINICDTGLVRRSLINSEIVTILVALLFNGKGSFLDYAGGYGLFTRLLRDIGLDYYWQDMLTDNLMARMFEYDNNIVNFELVTTFESFEHFINPIDEINNILKLSNNIFFTTDLLPNPIPDINNWYYYGVNHGQHISFYTTNSLEYIAKTYKLHLISYGSYHLMTKNAVNKFIFLIVFVLHKLGTFIIFKQLYTSKTTSDYIYISNKI